MTAPESVESIMALADEYGSRRAVELVDYADDFGDSGADIGSLTDKTNAARAVLRAAVEQLADAVTWVPVLRERAERAEQDAARYRWLRDSENAPQTYGELYGTDQLDSAIDAAMKGEKE